jgi:glycosyltransferase involved in cell wall biosynthesis
MSSRDRTAPDVVMVLENSQYPLDARVRMEAETLIEAGLSVEVLAPREPERPARETIRQVRVSRFPLPDGNGRLLGTAVEYLIAFCVITALVLPRLARRRGGTLHVHNPPDFFFPLLWLARLRGWSTVFDHHDDAAGMLQAKLGRRTRAALVLAWMRDQSARAADLTITTNDTQRELVQAVARCAIVVRNSPPVWFADHRPSPPAGRVKLVFLGEIGAQDRVQRTVDILAALVRDGGVDAELLIIGDGPERRAVQERAQRLGVDERVTITGWVPFEEVPGLLASAHVGLDTASATEVNHGSTMVKILEYLAVGLPVVATGLRETKVTGGDAVVTVERDTVEAYTVPILELLSSPETWQASADRARIRGTQLLWPAQSEKLLDAYRNLKRP